jgi:hypothetical protein
MADTLPDVALPANEWVDLYAATGITVGTQINVQNVGASDFRIATSAAAPVSERGEIIEPRKFPWQNSAGESGAWALSKFGGLATVAVA